MARPRTICSLLTISTGWSIRTLRRASISPLSTAGSRTSCPISIRTIPNSASTWRRTRCGGRRWHNSMASASIRFPIPRASSGAAGMTRIRAESIRTHRRHRRSVRTPIRSITSFFEGGRKQFDGIDSGLVHRLRLSAARRLARRHHQGRSRCRRSSTCSAMMNSIPHPETAGHLLRQS